MNRPDRGCRTDPNPRELLSVTVTVTVTFTIVDRCCGKQEMLNRPDQGFRMDKNPREPLPLPLPLRYRYRYVTVTVTVTFTFTVVDRCCGKQEVLNRPDRGCRTDKNPREPLARVLAKTYP